MTFVRKSSNGSYYLARTPRGSSPKDRGRRGKKVYRDWWLIKHWKNGDRTRASCINFGKVIIPNGFIGKKIRFKVEILDE